MRAYAGRRLKLTLQAEARATMFFVLGTMASAADLCPVYWQNGTSELRLFPMDGKEVALPFREASNLSQVVFDGKAVYGSEARQFPPGRPAGITKIEFNPLRQSIVPGSEGFGTVWNITMSQSSGKIFVAGWTVSQATHCGYFEIDPKAATFRTLRGVPPNDCGQGMGPISPGGTRTVNARGAQIGLLDFETGAFQTVKGLDGAGPCNWSPDGKMLACNRGGRIVLVDVETLRLRSIGGSGNGVAKWSPDGKNLLVYRDQLSCIPTLYGASLAVLDVATGRRQWVKSAHCSITGGSYYGWVDREAVR